MNNNMIRALHVIERNPVEPFDDGIDELMEFVETVETVEDEIREYELREMLRDRSL